MTQYNVEDVFVTEGVPKFTFVRPRNFGDILVDIRRPGKPVIIEGQSGTGKTTAVKKILEVIYPDSAPALLTPREPDALPKIASISEASGAEIFIIDDFHRLENNEKNRIGNLAKLIAERDDRSNLPKIVIIGINNVGSDLIQMVPDVAKRLGIHKIAAGSSDQIGEIINRGSELLRVEIENHEEIVAESRGDYWLVQQLCKSICNSAGAYTSMPEPTLVSWDKEKIVARVVETLEPNYDPTVRTFCRGRRFRPTNDPYFKLLRLVASQDKSNVDLNELANAHPEVKGSINNIKDHRLSVLIEEKNECSRYFYYDRDTKNFALEDPALFFYIRNLNWESLRERCGFRDNVKDYDFDVAISFAGENRTLAEFITKNLEILDMSVFYDKNFEDNYLGGPWSKHFNEIFVEQSRIVVVLLDTFHHEKVWPTFERDCFAPRVKNAEVIPVRLDDTVFVGIPNDLVSIHFKMDGSVEDNEDKIINEVVFRIAAKLESM